MKVRELIAALQAKNPDEDVVLFDGDGGFVGHLDQVDGVDMGDSDQHADYVVGLYAL